MQWQKTIAFVVTGMACRALERFGMPPLQLWLAVFAIVMVTATLIDGHDALQERRIVNEHLPWNLGMAVLLATVIATGILP